MTKQPTLDMREKLAHIDQMLAAHDRDRLLMFADYDRRRQEIQHAPWLVAFAGMTAGAALLGAGVALGAGLLRFHGL